MNTSELPKDPLQNYLERIPQPLDAMFSPKTVALIGAKDTPGSVGRTLLLNLKANGSHIIYPVNPKRTEVMGLACYPKISAVPSTVDLAVIVTPAPTVPGIIAECVETGVRSAIVITSGFKEIGEQGAKLEEEIKRCIKGKMPVMGPNCLGVMNPIAGLNATFAKGMANKGNVAFISQSGALCTAILDWSFQENIGFSAFVSVGSMIDVAWGDLISFFGDDPNTHSILLYVETVGNPRRFLSAAREVALQKPIVLIKPGRTQAAAKAAASHTGSLAGNDAVFDAALERVGILRVNTIAELFDMAQVLAKQPLPKGPNLGIITNAGGPAVIATDAAIQNGASIPPLSDETKQKLSSFLPPSWSRANPVDILGDASHETYDRAIKIMLEAQEFDGLLTILTPQDMTEPLETAECLAKYTSSKPILASWMGAAAVLEGIKVLNKGGICTFEFSDEAAAAFAKMYHHHVNLLALYEVPATVETILPNTYEKYRQRIKQAERFITKTRTMLSEEDSKALLLIYDIPAVKTHKATSAKEAEALAEMIGYPVVLKLLSSTITHKSDVGGVKLNLRSKEEVQTAFNAIQNNVAPSDFDGVTVQKMIPHSGYELILGSSRDPQFGPVILFGAGGVMVEIFQDTALGLPPLGLINAERLIEKTKIYKALSGFRGKKGVNREELIRVIVNFSRMIVENPWIEECDINPLLASSEGIIALDARVGVNPKEAVESSIRPYPFEYCEEWKLKNGTPVMIRPIKADDVPLLKGFHEELSANTVHQRYLKFLTLSERVTNERLSRICLNDFTHEYVLVAELVDAKKIIGVIRLSRIPSSSNAQLFMVIADTWQRQGLGRRFMEKMITIAQKEKIDSIVASILSENKGMISLCKSFGFSMSQNDGLVIAKLIIG